MEMLDPSISDILVMLKSAFPSGGVTCWGDPSFPEASDINHDFQQSEMRDDFLDTLRKHDQGLLFMNRNGFVAAVPKYIEAALNGSPELASSTLEILSESEDLDALNEMQQTAIWHATDLLGKRYYWVSLDAELTKNRLKKVKSIKSL